MNRERRDRSTAGIASRGSLSPQVPQEHENDQHDEIAAIKSVSARR